MRLVKLKDGWDGVVIFGTAKIVSDKNNNIVTETEPNIYGMKRLKFKCRGASRLIECKDGTTRRKWQRVWCSIDSESQLANTIRDLSYGDIVYLFGVQSLSRYTDQNTGRERTTTFCNIEYITIMSKVSETKAEIKEAEFMNEDGVNSNEFDDFDI